MNKKVKHIGLLIGIVPVPLILISLLTGPTELVHGKGWWGSIISMINGQDSGMAMSILINIRLPRVILAFLVGGSLAVSGSALQAVFRNPLVCPYILGIASGAAFGAALALASGIMPVQLSAFIFSLAAVLMSFFLSGGSRKSSTVTLVLSGIIVSGIFTALLSVIQFLADPFRLQTIVHWTMGNLHNSNWEKLYSSAIPMLAGVTGLIFYRWRLNVLAMGVDEARSAGINPARDSIIILLFASLATSASVASAGIIGMYGLMIPHIIRMISGPDNRNGIVLNFLFGGSFLLLIDNFARTLMQFEIPTGIFTMLLGAPVFIILLRNSRYIWN